MKFLGMCLFCCVFFAGSNACAAIPEGSWKFERSADYFGRMPANEAPQFTTITFRDDEVRLSAACVAKVSLRDYSFPRLFQPEDPMGEFFVIGDRILFVAGATFYSYVKTQTVD